MNMKELHELNVEDIKTILLITGDEVIGPIEEYDGGVVIAKPAKFIPLEDGKMMVVSLFMFGDFEQCQINNIHIISIVQARKEIAKAWLEKMTGKKSIIKPEGGIVLP